MPQLSVGTTATSIPASQGRTKLFITNEGSADEVVRADEDREEVSASAHIAYNRESVKFSGPIAARRIWVISDTAATTVSYSQIHK